MDQDVVEKIYNIMVWEKETISENDEDGVEKEIIKIDTSSKIGNTADKIAIILVKTKKPLPNNPIVVFGHGNGEPALDYVNYSEYFCPYGMSICCVDYRGYGYADGTFGTGATEPDDMITVINYLKSQGYEKISYFGYSLGARCGLFVASQFPWLVCVVLDSPWLSNREWTEFKAKEFDDIDHASFEKALPYVYKQILEITGIDFNQIKEARDIVGKICQPLYLFHGKKDDLVPYSNSEELNDLVQSKEKIFKAYKIGHQWCSLREKVWFDMFRFILKHNGVKKVKF